MQPQADTHFRWGSNCGPGDLLCGRIFSPEQSEALALKIESWVEKRAATLSWDRANSRDEGGTGDKFRDTLGRLFGRLNFGVVRRYEAYVQCPSKNNWCVLYFKGFLKVQAAEQRLGQRPGQRAAAQREVQS